MKSRSMTAIAVTVAAALILAVTFSTVLLGDRPAPSTLIVLAVCILLVGLGLRFASTAAAARAFGSVLIVGGVVSLVAAVVLTGVLVLSCCS